MPRPVRDVEQILQIARMHYEDRLRQSEIAQALGISVATVSRHLQQALTLGLVEMRVVSSVYRKPHLEAELVRALGLVSACVVDTGDSPAVTENTLAEAAARMLEAFIVPRGVIGVSNGRTLSAVVHKMRRARTADVDIVTLIGGIGRAESSSQTGEICRVLAENLGGRAWIMPVPAVVQSAELAQAIVSSDAAAEVFGLIEGMSAAVVGVGAMGEGSSTFQHGLFERAHLDSMLKRNAAGSICARFYDTRGRTLDSSLDARTISITHAGLRSVPARIGVAFGPDKTLAIAAAVRGGLLNHLATDSETAEALLRPPA